MRKEIIAQLFTFAFILFLSAGIANADTGNDKGNAAFSFDGYTAVSDTGDPKEHHDMKEHKEHEMHHSEDVEEHSVENADKIWNKYCPVRGGEIDPETPTVEYEGKTIGFCCPGCDKKFSKDPEKYLKNLSKDGQEYIGEK